MKTVNHVESVRNSSFSEIPHPHPTPSERREALLEQPKFGHVFSDHMVTVTYDEAQGWHSPTLGPLRPFSLHPATAVLHYAQEVFEGLKAHRRADGSVVLFRVEQHAERFNRSLRRMAMPELPPELFVESLERLVQRDADWVPGGAGQSLYLRPFAFATETALGAGKPSSTYTFAVLASPTGGWFDRDAQAISVWIEQNHIRAAEGGIGDVKAGANYAGALLSLRKSAGQGCDQIVWLDAVERKWIEEAGAMNLFFILDRGDGPKLVTPRLTGTFLPGITRRSIIEIAPELGIPVEEARISVDDWRNWSKSGELVESFACGTAAIIVSIGEVRTSANDGWTIGDGGEGQIARQLRERLAAIQSGEATDPFGWVREVVPPTAH